MFIGKGASTTVQMLFGVQLPKTGWLKVSEILRQACGLPKVEGPRTPACQKAKNSLFHSRALRI